ncbi:MAG TPA: acriflavin resistance protein [Clostridiales bacterium]|nr:acriflavin resistance protein [Clostridiales bacterium]
MLPQYSVRKPYTVMVAVILVITLGVISFNNMTTDLLPIIEMPYIIVMTSYPGASPEKIEQTVTRPLEAVLGTASGLQNISSISNENSSIIILEYVQDVNMDSATIELSGMIDLIGGQLADGIGMPMYLKISPGMLPVMVASIDREGYNTEELSPFAEDIVVPAFERLEGVASITTTGISDKQIQVVLDQNKIRDLNSQVQADLEETFAENLESLEEAQLKISDGLRTLKIESSGQKDRLAQGSVQVNSTIANLNALLSEESSLQAEKAAFEQEKALIENMLEQVKDFADLFLEGLTELEPEQIREILKILADRNILNMPLDFSQLTPKAIERIIEQLRESDGWFKQVFNTLIESLNHKIYQRIMQNIKDKLPEDLSELSQEEMSALLLQSMAASARLVALEMELQNVNVRQMTLAAMKPQLESALKQSQSAYEKMESGKITMAVELAKAQIQLENSQLEIEKGLEEFGKAREEALRMSDLSGILTEDMISGLIAAQNFGMPAGYITDGNDKHLVKVGEMFESREELNDLVLMNIEAVGDIRLKDIADITMIDKAKESYAKLNGNDGILLNFQKQSTASTSAVSEAINEKILELEQEFEGLRISPLMDQGDYIRIITDNVIYNLWIGGLLAVLLLLLFLRDFRPTIVIAFSIPISLMTAITLMYFTDVTLNVISLSGLALGVGMLVDNSIVVIDNIYRMRQEGVLVAKAAIEGTRQVSGSIIASTITTVCVFLPIVFTQGISRQLFVDMGLTIAYSLVASLVVALTLVPAMSSTVLRSITEKKNRQFDWFAGLYKKALEITLDKKALVVIPVTLLLILSVYGVSVMGTAFMGEMNSPQMSVNMSATGNQSKEEIFALNDEIMNRLLEIEDVETVGAISGGLSTLGNSSLNSDTSDETLFYILLKNDRSMTNIDVERLIYENTRDLEAELEVRSSNMDLSVLGGSGIQVMIKGQDLDQLARISHDIGELLEHTEGIANIDTNLENFDKETRILVDKNKAAREGLTTAQIYAEISKALHTEKQSTILTEDNDSYPVLIINHDQKGISKKNLADYSFTVKQKDGTEKEIKLKDISEIYEADSLESISRENQSRYMIVSAEIADGYNIGLVSRKFEQNIADYELPSGYSIEITGENEIISEALRDLVFMILLAVVFVYLIMVAQFQSLMSPFIVMFTLPLAFTGGLLLLWAADLELSVIAMLGFLLLAGIVVNNGIVLISYINQLREEGMDKGEALVTASVTRLRPILLTALTTILAMSSMALGYGEGAELVQPMAVVTIGGLTYATLLTLFIVPVLYDILNRKPMRIIEYDKTHEATL